MVTYEYLHSYTLRIAHSDRLPILSRSDRPVSEFITSSGTLGSERKLIPTAEDERVRLHRQHSLVTHACRQEVCAEPQNSSFFYYAFKL